MFGKKEVIYMAKNSSRDLDNVTRIITSLPEKEAERVLKELKKEKDPDEKRKIIEHELKKKGLKPL